MLQTWKFSIKPEAQPGFDPFIKCKELGIVGLGWSDAYKDKQADCFESADLITTEHWKGKIPQLGKLFEEIHAGDHLWMHNHGHYYLCIAGSKRYFGSQICEDFLKYDLGHAIDAQWIKIPEELVSGSIQRGVIARRMIQKIGISDPELKLNKLLAKELSINPNWFPELNDFSIGTKIQLLSRADIFAIMSPDDVEDVIASILQTEGWILLKSTCFRSKPMFEFSMTNKESKVCLVQVKSGKFPNQLPPGHYAEYLNERNEIVLFSSHPDPYPGNKPEKIRCLTKEAIFEWIKQNHSILSSTLKLKIDLCFGSDNKSSTEG